MNKNDTIEGTTETSMNQSNSDDEYDDYYGYNNFNDGSINNENLPLEESTKIPSTTLSDINTTLKNTEITELQSIKVTTSKTPQQVQIIVTEIPLVENSSTISTSTLNLENETNPKIENSTTLKLENLTSTSLENSTETKIEISTKSTTISSTSEKSSNSSETSTTSLPPSDLTSQDFFQNLNSYLNSKVPIFCYLSTIFLLILINIVTLITCCCCIRRRKKRMSHSLVDSNFGHSLYDVSLRGIPPRPPRRENNQARTNGRDNSTLLVNNHRKSELSQDRLRPLERRESSEF